MRPLFEMDMQDYDPEDRVFHRPSARGIIFLDDRRLALVYSRKEGYYKFPGGGIHPGETPEEALIREVREEAGLLVRPETIRPFGSVLRRQKIDSKPHTVFEQENYYFTCQTEERVVAQELDRYEAQAGFVLRPVELEEAIRVDEAYRSDSPSNEVMIAREARVLRLLQEQHSLSK